MRGAVSLAVALALPLTTDAGGAFPQRDLIIFLTFAVIFFTLVVQGLSLPGADPPARDHRRRRGRGGGGPRRGWWRPRPRSSRSTRSTDEEWTRNETLERMRGLYEYRKRRFAARAGKIEDDGYEDRSLAYQQTVQVVIAAQREALVQMRRRGRRSPTR